MPIMRGKIQAILTTDAALLYGLGATLEIGGEEWKYGERWTIRLQGKHSTKVEMLSLIHI